MIKFLSMSANKSARLASIALLAVALVPYKFASAQAFDLGEEIEQLSGYELAEIDGLYAAQQEPDLVLIAYEIAIPIVTAPMEPYILLRIAATGQWVRVPVPSLSEWMADWVPAIEALGVEVHRRPLGTTGSFAPDADAADIALVASASAEANHMVIAAASGNAAGIKTVFEYDALGRLTKITQGSNDPLYYILDAAGNRETTGPSTSPPPEPNTVPIATDDSVVIYGLFQFVTKNLVANDTDADGDSLTIVSVGNPLNADVTLINSTTVQVRSTDTGIGSFDYTVSDGNGGTATATVTVDVREDSGGGPISYSDPGSQVSTLIAGRAPR